MKRLFAFALALFVFASTNAQAQYQQAQSLRIVPQSSTPPNLATVGNVGLFSSTGGACPNLPSWVQSNGTVVCITTGAAGGVTSVSNADGSLTSTPTTGAVVVSLNTAHANTFTANQTFNNPIVIGAGLTSTAGTIDFSGNPANFLSTTGTTTVPGALLILGAGDAGGSPAGLTMRAPNAAGNNIAAPGITVQVGLSTGNAVSGNLVFNYSPPGGSGSTLQTPTNAATINGTSGLFSSLKGASLTGGANTIGDSTHVTTWSGGIIEYWQNKAASYSATANDYGIFCTSTASSRTFDFPDNAAQGTSYCVTDQSNAASPTNTITIKGHSTSQVNGAAGGWIITSPGATICIVSDGTNYWVK